MNVVFVFNFYTSFQKIFQKQKIIETGNISLIKIIKKISLSNKVSVILLDKNLLKNDYKIVYSSIENINFYIVPYNYTLKNFNFLFFLISLFFLIKNIIFLKKSTIYTDRGNIFLAFLIKTFSPHKVIIRILGITNQIENINKLKTIRGFINNILWKKKYDLIIHSNDGSNFRLFNDEYLNNKNKVLILNQGIKKINFTKTISNKFKILLSDNFASEYKNINIILTSLKSLDPDIKKNISLYIVYLNKNEKKKIKKKLTNFNEIIFIEKLSNTSLLKLKSNCNAIITFNSMGYLSNNIVESIFYNNWIITPEYHLIKKNIPKKYLENFIFIDKNNLKISLNNKLKYLLINWKKLPLKFKDIDSLDEKISKEIDLLRGLKFIN